LWEKGRAGVCCFYGARHGSPLPFAEPPLDERGGAPKSANLWLRIRCRIRRAPLGAPHALKQRSGSACYLRTFIRHQASLSGFAGGRSNAPPSSASSWRGLLVVPGGAPMPPECSCCVHEPAGAAPRPASRTPRDAPFKWTRWVQHNWGLGARGITYLRC
jgi:hypothetical protein